MSSQFNSPDPRLIEARRRLDLARTEISGVSIGPREAERALNQLIHAMTQLDEIIKDGSSVVA